jgi:DNA polymerase-1
MITFGLPYGRSAKGLAPQIGATVAQAKKFIAVYFKRYPALHKWILKTREKGVADHVAYSIFGRRRRFPFIPDRWAKKEMMRQAGNFPIQSGINDLTLLAQINSIEACRAAGIPVKPGMHIHDSLNFAVPIPMWVQAARLVNEVMLNVPFESEVPFRGEVEIGSRWGNMITVIDKQSRWAELDPEKEDVPEYLVRMIPSSGDPV